MWSLATAMWNGYRVRKLLHFNIIVTDSPVEWVEKGTGIGWS
jgi:hypothetical protein